MAIALRHVRMPSPVVREPDRPIGRIPEAPPPVWRVWTDRAIDSLTPLILAMEAGYGAALVGVAAATGVALVLRLGSEPGIFAPFLVAIFAVALRYGIGPALVTIFLSALVTYIRFLAPMVHLAIDPAALRTLALFRLGVFAGAGVAATLIAELHRQRLQQFEHSCHQLRAFTANDEIGLQAIGHDGTITWADPTAASLLGYDATEYVGRTFASLHADSRLAVVLQRRLAGGFPIENLRATLTRKDGTTQDVLLNSNTLLGDATTPDTSVLVAMLPVKTVAVHHDEGKIAVVELLERRRKASADRSATPPVS